MNLTRSIIGLTTSIMTATSLAAELDGTLKEELDALIERGHARAIVVGVYDNGNQTVHGFGRVSDTEEATPDGDTTFEIGSITKVFTALLAQVQSEDGRLAWDQTIGDSLAAVEFANEAVASVTLSELASHTSGLPRIPDNMEMADSTDPYAGYGRAELLEFIAKHDPNDLDKRYSYSNLGAGLLGVIAADASGTSYSASMEKYVLAPLGMRETQVGLRSPPRELAAGFSRGANMPNWDGFDALAGSGALTSTTNDMLRFIAANAQSDPLGESLAALREQALANRNTAFGWHVAKATDGEAVLWHNGGTGGYASFLAVAPETGRGLSILTTSTEYNVVTDIGMNAMTGRVSDSADNLEAYTGVFDLGQGLFLTVYAEAGRLYGQATGQGAFPLARVGEGVYAFEPAGIRIEFDPIAEGVAETMIFNQGGRAIRAQRTDPSLGIQQRSEMALSPEQLADFEGSYQLAPNAVFKLEVRDGQLYAQLTGQQALPVFPYAPDKFFYKVVDAELWFARDERGSVIELELHQGGRRTAPKIKP